MSSFDDGWAALGDNPKGDFIGSIFKRHLGCVEEEPRVLELPRREQGEVGPRRKHEVGRG